jgi:hypothetical protein
VPPCDGSVALQTYVANDVLVSGLKFRVSNGCAGARRRPADLARGRRPERHLTPNANDAVPSVIAGVPFMQAVQLGRAAGRGRPARPLVLRRAWQRHADRRHEDVLRLRLEHRQGEPHAGVSEGQVRHRPAQPGNAAQPLPGQLPVQRLFRRLRRRQGDVRRARRGRRLAEPDLHPLDLGHGAVQPGRAVLRERAEHQRHPHHPAGRHDGPVARLSAALHASGRRPVRRLPGLQPPRPAGQPVHLRLRLLRPPGGVPRDAQSAAGELRV